MAEQLRALALAEDSGSLFNTQHPQLSGTPVLVGVLTPSSGLCRYAACIWHIYIH